MSQSNASKVLAIVRDYLESPDAQVRRNVVTALAEIGSGDCVPLLVDLAIKNPDASVRRHATAELCRLTEENRQAAAEYAKPLLHEPGAEGQAGESIQGQANDLLAAFRNDGLVLDLPKRSFSERFGLCWTIRRLLLRDPPPPLWRPLLLTFVGALLGATLNAWWILEAHPELGKQVFPALVWPAAILSSLLLTVTSRGVAPVERYCDPDMGILVETVGALWRPAEKLWLSLSVVGVIAVVIASGTVPLKLEFEGLGAGLVHYLAWILAGILVLGVILMTMRAVSAAAWKLGHSTSVLAGGFAGGLVGLLSLLAALRFWTDQLGVAVLVSEGLYVLLPLTTGFICERLLTPLVPARRQLSRIETLTPVAILVVLLPGLWLRANPLLPQTPKGRWLLAKVPVHLEFAVTSDLTEQSRRICAWIRPENGDNSDFVLRLWSPGRAEPFHDVRSGQGWDVEEAGEYRLEVSVKGLKPKRGTLDFLVWDEYAAAVGFLAYKLVVDWLEEPEKRAEGLVGVYELELVVSSGDQCESLIEEPSRFLARTTQ